MFGVLRFLRRLLSSALIAGALIFLSVLVGGIAVLRGVEPLTSLLRKTDLIVSYVYFDLMEESPIDRRWWPAATPLPDNPSAIITYDERLAQPGVNLVMSAERTSARLISMDGRELHRWSLPFEKAWPGRTYVDGANEGTLFYWRRVHLFPNGDLLVVYESPDVSPHGIGLAKIDKNSNLLWAVSERAHHDVAVDDKGFIYILNSEISAEAYPDLRMIAPPFFKEAIVKVSPDGEVVARWPIIDAFLRSDDWAPAMLRLGDGRSRGDYTHANTVAYVDAKTAERFPFANEGQILISMREMDTIALFDPANEEVVWAMEGMWHRQHEPQFLDNGNMIIFDNRGHVGAGGASRIVEFDPIAGEARWIYAGTAEEPLYSSAFGGLQRLANGNTLITESHNGRAIEVTPNKEIVWEYRHPERTVVDDREYIVILFDVQRVDPAKLTFLGSSSD